MNDYPLLTVIIAALAGMMFIQIFGVYYDAAMPKEITVKVYECNFSMRESVLTMPCTINGEIK